MVGRRSTSKVCGASLTVSQLLMLQLPLPSRNPARTASRSEQGCRGCTRQR
jgi:hypothetical protein